MEGKIAENDKETAEISDLAKKAMNHLEKVTPAEREQLKSFAK